MTDERDPFAEPWDGEDTDSLGRPVTGGPMLIAPAPRRPAPPIPAPSAKAEPSAWGVVGAIIVLSVLAAVVYLGTQQFAR